MKTPEKVVINNLMFVLVDVIECLMLDAEKLYKQDGQAFKHESKMHFNKSLFHLRKFLTSIRECSIETQMQFGDDCEELKKLLLLYTDRVNDDKARTELFMNYLISNSSLLDFDFKKVGIEL